MVKNIILLVILSWVTVTYAKTEVAHDSMTDAENYKIEKPVHEEAPKRSVAGGKIKKRQAPEGKVQAKEEVTTESDSEVRYWQYSE